jgi:hypothetical protein
MQRRIAGVLLLGLALVFLSGDFQLVLADVGVQITNVSFSLPQSLNIITIHSGDIITATVSLQATGLSVTGPTGAT